MGTLLDQPIAGTDRDALIQAHYSLQLGYFFSEQSQAGGGILALSSSSSAPLWNHAAWTGGGESDFRKFIETARSWQEQRHRRPVIYIYSDASFEAALLEAAGFERFDEEAWMSLPLALDTGAHDLDVRLVHSENEMEDFWAVFRAAYNTTHGAYAEVLRKQEPGKCEHFTLYSEGRPVSAGTILVGGELACIYNIATPPAERKKGYALRLMKSLLARAAELGCTQVFLQVERHSNAQRLYLKLGFTEVFSRVGYRQISWSDQSDTRGPLSALFGPAANLASTPRFARENRPVPGALLQDATALSRQKNIRLETILGAAWAVLLFRYSGESTITFDLAGSDGRVSACRVELEDGKPVSEWLQCLQKPSAELNKLRAETRLTFGSASESHLDTRGYPLELIFDPAGSLELVFRVDLFPKDAVRRMAGHFLTLLESVTRSPQRSAKDLEMLTPAEKHQLLVGWNQSDFTPSREIIQQLFERQVEKTPDAAALILALGDKPEPVENLTYRQLNRRANKLAHHLKKLGVGPESCVGVFLNRGSDMIISLLAIWKAGGVCVPLDPAYPAERIHFMLQDTKAPVLLTTSAGASALGNAAHAQIVCLDKEWEPINQESEKNPPIVSQPENAAYIIYTSGSTGRPKGVVITNHAIANHSLDCRSQYGLSRADKILQFSSFNFDASFEQIVPALISGAALVLRGDDVWTLQQFAEKLSALRLTVTDIPTAYWHELAEQWHANPASIPPNNLRMVIVGGEAISPRKLELWLKTPLRKVRLINAYGPTETTITATSFEFPPENEIDRGVKIVPIGRPRADRKAYVLDRAGNPVPVGIPGELHIGGSLLARGYLNRPELTEERFISNPFCDETDARLYKTGDLVRWLEDGNLEFLGRIDDQVKIRGFRIELGEIESVLRAHSAVRETLVLARPDSSGEKRLFAYVISAGKGAEAKALRSHLKEKLPSYMVPSQIVVMDQWPLLPNGKIDRRALPVPEEQPAPPDFHGPRDPLELQLQLIFERVLKRAPVAIDSSFFELGGDSLQALELLVQIEKATGKSLPLGTLYQSSSVEALANEVKERSEGDGWSSLVPLQRSGTKPPFFLLHTTPGDILGYGNLVYRLGGDQPCYGFQSLGLKEPTLSHTRVEQMAEYYTSLLRGFQPEGPYYLGGWCYGGIVAVEMARLLKAQGQEVALLALLETVAMPPALSNFRYYLHRLQCSLEMGPRRWIEYVQAKARYVRDSRLANRMRFRQAVGDPHADLSEIDPRLARLEQVYNTNLAALNDYRSRYYDGKVTLLNARDKDAALIPDPYYGWVGLAREIEIHEVPGDHDTMLTEPNVAVLAQTLERCLQQAQSKSSPR